MAKSRKRKSGAISQPLYFSFEGQEEYVKKLRKMENEMIDKIASNALDKGLKAIKEDAEATDAFTDHTGRLRGSIEIKKKIGKKGALGMVGTEVEYARLIEYVYTPGFLRPAFDQNKHMARHEVIEEIKKAVEKVNI